ncbi:MAG TPA: aminoacetone oxidase family FAD-binding enzyme [Candidatus Eisenbacteria bacterium]
MAVVGAGAAGLTAALRAAESGARVTLLNAHPKIGLKILMSGGTRCNVTHERVDERDFHGGSRAFVRRVLSAFSAEQARAWIESLGVALKLEPTGKLFPETDNAHTVLDALLGACRRAGVAIEAGARVARIERAGEAARGGGAGGGGAGGDAGDAGAGDAGAETRPRYRLGIQRVRDSAAFGAEVAAVGEQNWPLPPAEPDEWIEADAVILATGGLSFPRTGSDGTGYALAASLGHTIVPPVPALTPLAASDALCARLQGLTLEAELTLRVEGKRTAATSGSFLFTHFGYSGPAALDLSRHWHRAEGDRTVSASFLPGESPEGLREAWLAAARDSHLGVRRHLGARLPDRLVVALCEECGVPPGAPLTQVERARREGLLRLITARALPVTGTLGYEKAEVTAGGVALAEVDPRTLESRKAPGVFLCGEILDVEGRLGGFNFQWSWSSGTVAGRSAGRLVS